MNETNLKLKREKETDHPGNRCEILVDDVGFSWNPNQPRILDGLCLEIEPGERIFIGGASGSGKTTLLGLLSGILVPQQGAVKLLGRVLSALSGVQRDRFRADHIGYIHQQFNLVSYLSVLENITLPLCFSRRRHERALRQSPSPSAEARRLLEHLGLSDPALLKRSVRELSVGQQQRVAVARALIGAPEILIADEPTSALDAATREQFIKLLFSQCAESRATLLFVSHDASLGPMFHRTVQLEGGGAC